MTNDNVYLGMDIGGTNTVLGIVDEKGKSLARISFRTRSDEPFSVFLSNFEKEFTTILSDFNKPLYGIGVGAPGASNKSGVIENLENFNWGRVEIAKILTRKYNKPVKIINDANAAAIGVMKFGLASDLKFFLQITLGTGLGSCAVINGEIVSGYNGMAGELGHTKVFKGNRMCSCGKRGCLESYVSAEGICRTVFELLSSEREESGLREYTYSNLTSRIVTDFAEKGDSIAVKAYNRTGTILGEKLADTVSLFNPKAIVFSGGVVSAGDFLFEPMTIALEDSLLQMHKNSVEIRVSEPDINYAVLGAASLVMNNNGSKINET